MMNCKIATNYSPMRKWETLKIQDLLHSVCFWMGKDGRNERCYLSLIRHMANSNK